MTTITQNIRKESYPLTLLSSQEEKSDQIRNGEELVVAKPLDIPLPPPSIKPTSVLEIDRDTPDHHVPRDPRLIRLTGVHPFNVEAPLTDLFNEGK
jgi:nitrate reductase (NAD(P)H)